MVCEYVTEYPNNRKKEQKKHSEAFTTNLVGLANLLCLHFSRNNNWRREYQKLCIIIIHRCKLYTNPPLASSCGELLPNTFYLEQKKIETFLWLHDIYHSYAIANRKKNGSWSFHEPRFSLLVGEFSFTPSSHLYCTYHPKKKFFHLLKKLKDSKIPWKSGTCFVCHVKYRFVVGFFRSPALPDSSVWKKILTKIKNFPPKSFLSFSV